MPRFLILVLLFASSTASAKEKNKPTKPLKHPIATVHAPPAAPSPPSAPTDPFGGDEPSTLDRNPPPSPTAPIPSENKGKKRGRDKTPKGVTKKNTVSPTPAPVEDKTPPKPAATPDPFGE